MVNLKLVSKSFGEVKAARNGKVTGQDMVAPEPDSDSGSFGLGLGLATSPYAGNYTIYGLPARAYYGDRNKVYYVNASMAEYSTHWVSTDAGNVGMLYALYRNNPYMFDANTPQAFDNREVVYNLAFVLMGEDWYSTFMNTVKNGRAPLNSVNFLADLMRTIGVGDGKKPRFNLPYHVNVISTMWAKTGGGIVASMEDYEGAFELSPSNGNTVLFIRACLNHGGFGFLLATLAYMFGPYKVNEIEDHRANFS